MQPELDPLSPQLDELGGSKRDLVPSTDVQIQKHVRPLCL